MNLFPSGGYLEDSHSGEYDSLSTSYADMWARHEVDPTHYLNVRTAYLKWIFDLRDQGIKATDGSLVIAGPGFQVASQRDFEPAIIKTYVSDHPRVIVTDFSREVLQDADLSLSSASKSLRPRLRLARRDLSYGLSSKFESVVGSALDTIQTVEEFKDFMSELEQEFSVTALEAAPARNLKAPSREGEAAVLGITAEEGLNFTNVAQGTAKVRFFVANLLLTGMFAVTEGEFRDKLMHFAEQYPEEISKDHIRTYLSIWHDVIRMLNNHVASLYFRDAAKYHPEARHMVVVDETSVYEDLDRNALVEIDALGREVSKYGVTLRTERTWTLDDTKEVPPHHHGVVAVFADVKPVEETIQVEAPSTDEAA